MRATESVTEALCDDYAEALAKFRYAIEERHASKYTLKAYLSGAERFLSFLQRDMKLRVGLDNVSKEHCREWLRSLRESSLKPASIRALYQAARQLFKAAIEDNDIPSGVNPFDGLPLPPVEMKEVTILSPEDVQAMVAAAGRDRSKIWGARDQAIIVLLYDSGLRSSELVQIRGDDIDWEAGAILIPGKGRRERWVGLGATALRALNRYLNARKRYEAGKKWWQKEGEASTIWLSGRTGVVPATAVRPGTSRATAR